MQSRLIWLVVIVIGAAVLTPAIAMIGLPPLPGDFSFRWGYNLIYVPIVTALLVSVSLTLLFLIMRR